MKKIHHGETISRALLSAVLILTSVLTFALYYLVINPKTAVYGATGSNVDISVRVEPDPLNPHVPVINDIGPLSGPVSGGTILTIRGDHLDSVTTVDLGGGLECAPINYISEHEITCTMPAHPAGYVTITVISPDYGSDTKTNGFRYLGNGDVPGVPNTGLFRLGQHIVTLYDIFVLGITAVLLGSMTWWLIVGKRAHGRESD